MTETSKEKKKIITRLSRAERSERDLGGSHKNFQPEFLKEKETSSPTTKELNQLKDDALQLKTHLPAVNSLQSLRQLDL